MLKPGEIVNETYRVEKLLGSGGMADVYIVTHLRMPRKFALKVMRIQSAARQDFLERFNRECEILATLQHPHIVDVTDRHHLSNGDPYLVMELLEGEDLATYLARTGALSVPVALRICNQIGEALEAAHKVGVVHRDLKPSNVFLSKQGSALNFVKVLDFGIAKISKPEQGPSDQPAPLTQPHALMGTPGYMAPEQARGENSTVGPATDQFALAATLYEMLAGKPAFYQPGDTAYATLERVITSFPAPLSHQQINAAIMRALSKKAEERFPSLREFLAAVGATTHTVYGSPASVAPSTPGTLSSNGNGERTLAPKRMPWGRLAASLSLGAVVALVAVSAYFRVRPGPAQLTPPIQTPAAPQPLQLPSSTPNASAAAPPTTGTVPPLVVATNTPPPSPVADVVSTPATTGSVAPMPPAPSPTVPAPPAEAQPAKAGQVKPGTGTKPTPPKQPSTRTVLRFTTTMSGKTKVAMVDLALTSCAREHLTPVGLPVGSVIKLERSGTLAVVDGPPAVHQTNFNACVRQTLSRIPHTLLPETATVHLTREPVR
jgi:serine/threonine protein kinase